MARPVPVFILFLAVEATLVARLDQLGKTTTYGGREGQGTRAPLKGVTTYMESTPTLATNK